MFNSQNELLPFYVVPETVDTVDIPYLDRSAPVPRRVDLSHGEDEQLPAYPAVHVDEQLYSVHVPCSTLYSYIKMCSKDVPYSIQTYMYSCTVL